MNTSVLNTVAPETTKINISGVPTKTESAEKVDIIVDDGGNHVDGQGTKRKSNDWDGSGPIKSRSGSTSKARAANLLAVVAADSESAVITEKDTSEPVLHKVRGNYFISLVQTKCTNMD